MPHYTAAHWGIQEVIRDRAGNPALRPWRDDPDPPAFAMHALAASTGELRVRRPAIRRGWLEHGPGPARGGRGRDGHVEVDWNTALDLVAGELARVRAAHGNEAIFGGSYGWASAGRFHHAQSQLHRFLNLAGGFVRSTHSYSLGAARVLLPHVLADMDRLQAGHDDWDTLAAHTRLMLCFGGIPVRNAQIDPGGAGRHEARGAIARMAARGCRFINVSPTRDDFGDGREQPALAEWIPIRPNTDTAFMLALAHELIVLGRHDRAFLASHCSGFGRFADHVLGLDDGQPKTPEWAADITGVPAARIAALARELGRERSLINVAWSLQRAEHGEQPYWAALALAAVIGHIGLPGGGIAFAYGAVNAIGYRGPKFHGPTLAQGRNPVSAFIPVARIADMLFDPGAPFEYDGGRHRYPHVRYLHWAGGNPFHHHQDLNRLVRAWQLPDTIVAHEQFWTAAARHADIVLPATTTLERADIGFSSREGHMVAMRPVIAPVGEARDDHAILAGIARRLGFGEAFTEGLDTEGWLRRLYEECRPRAEAAGVRLPGYDAFVERGLIDFSRAAEPPEPLLARFRADPINHPLPSDSGRIELHSPRLAGFGHTGFAGHPRWREPTEWLGAALARQYPLHLISDQPANKLHGQLDHSAASRADRVRGREPVVLHPLDAAERGLADGELVRVFNDRGACVAAVRTSDGLARGVACMATGAWFDPAGPEFDGVCAHGNPNVLTQDAGCSPLSQGCSAQSCLVQVERWTGPLPPVRAFDPPAFVATPPIRLPLANGASPCPSLT
ncbi:molybdopterin-dependent oxidoreductase [Derxia gummosa]|uniref:Molybdopterin-dependent oxidoreductase n=1 Tax=Derxia gummosa DSM 723 TaxID=1121388 RepID=A0A8B6XBH3_9BURK|nr:molybdopterin-dependent oxidoreductase [Derxia gummosa]